MSLTYPQISVELVGTDGNAYALIGTVGRALKDGGVSREQIAEWNRQAFEAPSYDDLLRFIIETVEVS